MVSNSTSHSAQSSGDYRQKTIAQVAAELADRRPDEVAIYVEDDNHITFGSVYQEALMLAAALQNSGLVAGDIVSFQLPNWRESAALDIAAALLGLVVNPIIPIYRDKEVGFILTDTKAKVVLIPQRFRGYDFPAMIERLWPQLANLQQVVVVRGDAPSQGDGFVDYIAYLEGAAAHSLVPAEVDCSSTKIVMYTSGTTGNPKAVRHSHNSLTKAFDNGAEAWQLGRGDVMLMPSPVTHITGFVNGIELPFFSEAKAAFMEQWQVDAAITYMKRIDATACISATPFLQELVNACAKSGERLPLLRMFACGGASVPPSLIYDTHRVLENCRAFRVYGSTESPLVTVGFRLPEQETLAAETDGYIFNWQVRIEDDDGNALPLGRDGEVLVRGPAMMQGYANSEQTQQAITEDGFFRTGDIGHITNDGAIVITDRKKDIIIRGGENLSAREIEDVLHAHPSIEQVAIVAMPHERLGEGVCACVVLSAKQELTLDSLKSFLATTGLAKQKWPEKLHIKSSLPMTASGKVKKDVLRNEIIAPADAVVEQS
ncbi:AMP-binding protein [Halioxenophilus aromaticivorans]|uniref:Cyclohexanecarboxylate-CoA ligase n=1 Tax=Halioxenophilus aromaticivorans TaxID=1306992 RepID=A0AAV3U6S4_9ALTE